jgi:arabinofuranan 3-O-arabinosyltransferase
VAQNYNTGWHATLDGRALTAVRLDGWQQGWLLPAGHGGTVVMTMPADTSYRLALLFGAVLLVLLAAGALIRRGRSDQAPTGPGRRVPTVVLGVLSLAVLALVCGPLAVIFHSGTWDGVGVERHLRSSPQAP